MLFNRYLFYLTFLFSLTFKVSHAQTARYGNEWINYDQPYFKIPITEKGIFRVTYDQLKSVGFPTEKNPVTYQLYKQGSEQAITVSGQEDGSFDPTDYVEFYGIPNDGARDSVLYRDPKLHTNPKISLFTDTTFYYLTFRLDNGRGKRMETVAQQPTSGLQPEPYHWHDQLLLFTTVYPVGPTYPIGVRYLSGMTISTYEGGKGYTDSRITNGTNRTYAFNISKPYGSGNKPQLQLSLYGGTPDPHNLTIKAGATNNPSRVVGNVTFSNYGIPLFKQELEWTDLGTNAFVNISAAPATTNEYCYLVYGQLSYPQLLSMEGVTGGKALRLRVNSGNNSFVQITQSSDADQIFDVTQLNAVKRIPSSFAEGTLSAVVPQTSSERRLWVNRQIRNVSSIKRVSFRKIDPAKANYLIVTDKRLQKSAGSYPDVVKAYAGYRASEAGGKHDTLVVDIDHLADQFNYGEKGVLAIRHFVDYMLQSGKTPHLFLVGRGIFPQYLRQVANFHTLNFVPAGGWPGSDIVTVQGLKEANVPAVPIGRLNATTPAEVLTYLNKVKEYEQQAPALWKKTFLNLSGGRSASELVLFRNYTQGYTNTSQQRNLGARVSTISKKTDDPVEFINISKEVNQGLGIITFFGHAAPQISDIDVGYVTNDELGYRNKGKYPIMIINGCDAGNIFNSSLTPVPLTTDWVNTADRGAILAIATSFSGFPSYLDGYTRNLFNEMFTTELGLGESFGTSVMNAIRSYLKAYPDEMALGHAQQFVLQGDPAIIPFPYKKPDYAVSSNTLFIHNPATVVTDSFQVGIVVSNLGKNVNKPFTVNLKRTLSNGREIDLGSKQYPAIAYQDTIYFTVNNQIQAGGNTRFDVTIDANNQLEELSKQNNKATLNVVLPGSLALTLLPHDFAIVGSQENGTPTARLVAEYTPAAVPSGTPQVVFELDTSAAFTSSFKKTTTLPISNADGWKVSLLSTDSTVYYWRVRSADQPQGSNNQWSTASFTYIKGSTGGWSQSSGTQFENVLTDVVSLQNSRWIFTGTSTNGTLSSSLIGPATQWGAIRQLVLKNAQQKSSLDVYGVDYQGNETLLYSNLTSTLTDIKNGVDAKKYPYLRLKEKISGPTAPQLKRWLVSYDEVPEGALHLKGQAAYVPSLTTYLTEGAPYTQELTFDLASTQLFTDSLTVTEVLTNTTSGLSQTKQYKVRPAKNIPLTITYPDLATGENRIAVTVNPQIVPEVSYTNNLITLIANSQPDRSAPILEVTFDGKTIQNGAYVSANPTILVRLKDENQYTLRTDTTGIDLYWQRRFPDTTALQRISFVNPNLTWEILPENDFRATYKPKNLPEGTYYFQVNGSDAAGNLAGSRPYNITFVVKNETGIQQFVVSPNPLMYYTRFSLNLTGESIPDAMSIEIYNLQGQLLRVISNETQKLQVGANDYYWDGTDQRGSRLPIGTYIYKLKIQDKGQPYPFLDPTVKSTGRVVIIR